MPKRKPLLVSDRTHARIAEEIARLMRSAESGCYESPLITDQRHKGNEPGISVDAFLAYLLDARERHRERRRAAGYTRSHNGKKGRQRVAPLPG